MVGGNFSKTIKDSQSAADLLMQGEVSQAYGKALEESQGALEETWAFQTLSFISDYLFVSELDLPKKTLSPSWTSPFYSTEIPTIPFEESVSGAKGSEDAYGWGDLFFDAASFLIPGGLLVKAARYGRFLKALPMVRGAARYLAPAGEVLLARGGALVRSMPQAARTMAGGALSVISRLRSVANHGLVRAGAQAVGSGVGIELVKEGIGEALEIFEEDPSLESGGETGGVSETEGTSETESDSDTGDKDYREELLRNFLMLEFFLTPQEIPKDLASTQIGQLLLIPEEEFVHALSDFRADIRLIRGFSAKFFDEVVQAQRLSMELYFDGEGFTRDAWSRPNWNSGMASFLLETRSFEETRDFGDLVYQESVALLMESLFKNLRHQPILKDWMDSSQSQLEDFSFNLSQYYLSEAQFYYDSEMSPEEFLGRALGFEGEVSGASMYQNPEVALEGHPYHTGRPGSALHAFMNTWLLLQAAYFSGRGEAMQGGVFQEDYSLDSFVEGQGLEPLQVMAASELFVPMDEDRFELRGEISSFGLDMMASSEVFNFFTGLSEEINSGGMDYLTMFHPGEPFQSAHQLTSTWRYWLLIQWPLGLQGQSLSEEQEDQILTNPTLPAMIQQWEEWTLESFDLENDKRLRSKYLSEIIGRETNPLSFVKSLQALNQELQKVYGHEFQDLDLEDPEVIKLSILAHALVFASSHPKKDFKETMLHTLSQAARLVANLYKRSSSSTTQ
ncbi:MAG: hypothetical protein KDK66_03900 [Deltaproteobacteria bacterium]|nr:hypothetical protein [Deltaproteobacteria bacterium]